MQLNAVPTMITSNLFTAAPGHAHIGLGVERIVGISSLGHSGVFGNERADVLVGIWVTLIMDHPAFCAAVQEMSTTTMTEVS